MNIIAIINAIAGSTNSNMLSPPFPPLALTIANITDSSFDCAITPGDGNPPTTQYAIQDVITGKYLGSVGLLDEDNPLWATASQWSLANIYQLWPGTLYQMRAIARDPVTLLTTNGPTINVTTNLPLGPFLAVRPTNQNCGNAPVGNPSAVFSFQFRGLLLDGTDVIIDSISFFSALQCCEFSTNSLGPFTQTITYSGYGTDIPITTIYYTCTPSLIGLENCAVTLTGGGSFNAINLDITGT